MEAARSQGAIAAIDDWFVPVVYDTGGADQGKPEVQPRAREPAIASEIYDPGFHGRAETYDPGFHRRAEIYDPGFHGRDDVLLELDRAFDTSAVIDLCGIAGSGKTATARQFVRWYAGTGGIAGDVVEVEIGLASGEATERILAALGGTVEEAVRRFAERPGVLFVNDVNAPPQDQRDRMNELFDRLTANGTRVLVTSHFAPWLQQAEHVRLGAMEVGDMVDLLRDRLGEPLEAGSLPAWRPVLDLANGNPLALEVLVEWCRKLPDREESSLRSLVDDVLSGDPPELPEHARRGLSVWPRSLVPTESWQQLLPLLHRQRFVEINELLAIGRPETPEHVSELEGVTGEEWAKLFIRLSVAGLMWQAHNTYFEIHPLFMSALVSGAGGVLDPERVGRIERSFAFMADSVGWSISKESEEGGNRERNLQWAASEEHNLRHAYELALRRGWIDLLGGCMEGLSIGYLHTGRRREWAALLEHTATQVVPVDQDPPAGSDDLWVQLVLWLNDLTLAKGDFQQARHLMERLVAHRRGGGGRDLAVALLNLAAVERALDDPRCVEHLLEAQKLFGEEDADEVRSLIAGLHFHLGLAYQNVGAVRDSSARMKSTVAAWSSSIPLTM